MTSAIDEVLELAAPSSPSSDTDTADAAPEGTQSAADTADAVGSTELYPNVLKSFKVGQDAPEDGANPEGTLTVAEFAGHLTIENFKAATAAERAITPELIVKDPNIYTAVRGKKHALPVVLVYPADSDEMRDAKVFLPVAEATEAYQKRPERGTSAAAVSKRSQEDILTDGAKKLNALKAIEVRLQRVMDQHATASKQMAKYYGWYRTYCKDVQPVEIAATETEPARMQTAEEAVDNAVKDAFEAKAAELEASAEAAKAAESPTPTA